MCALKQNSNNTDLEKMTIASLAGNFPDVLFRHDDLFNHSLCKNDDHHRLHHQGPLLDPILSMTLKHKTITKYWYALSNIVSQS